MANPIPSLEEISQAFSDNYDSIEEIRRGGQAVVYKARRIKNAHGIETGDSVALKLYFDPSQDERVLRETQTALAINSDCLCGLLSHGLVTIESRKYHFLIWSFIEGEALDNLLKKNPALLLQSSDVRTRAK